MASKIAQFMSVTGASEDTARNLLNACEGNLDLAVGMYMEDGAFTGTTDPHPSSVAIPDSDEVRAPIRPIRGVLVENEPPAGRLRRRKRNLPPSVFDPFRDVSSEVHTSDKRMATLSELFKPPLDLMFQGNFTEAKEAGATISKWLLVNIQDSREFSSQILNRDVWSNSRVKSVVSKRFLLWQAYRGTEEATKFCQFYAVHQFPFVAVVDPRTGELIEQWKLWTDAKPELFLDFASDFLSTHSLDNEDVNVPQAKRSRTDTDANIIDLSEEDQLEAAIAASISVNGNKLDSDSDDFVLVDSDGDEDESEDCCLVADVAKHSKNSNSTLDPSRLAYLNMTKKLPSNSSITKEAKGKGSARRNTEKSLVPMQKLSISEDSNNSSRNSSGNILHLLLRLPAGGRMECSFHDNHPVQELFDILSAQGCNVDEIEVVANFPRRVITMVNSLQSFKDVGLCSRETVFVQST